MKIILGKKYRDKVHGIVGIATAITSYLSGCDRVSLEFVKDGEIKYINCDVPMVELVRGETAVKGPTTAAKRGGPGDVASKKSAVSR